MIAPHTTVAVRHYGSRRFEILHDEVTAPTIITTKTSLPQQPSYLFRVLVAFTHSLYSLFSACSRTRNIHIWINDETLEYRYFYILVINIACSYLRKFIVQNNKYCRYCTQISNYFSIIIINYELTKPGSN